MGDLKTYLNALFLSKTIPPSFKLPHVFYTMFIIGSSPKGVGRYRIKSEIGLGEASTKTLLNHLKKQGFIDTKEQNQKGHFLTPLGQEFYNSILSRMSAPQPVENPQDRYVVGKKGAYSILKYSALKKNLVINIDARDEAIKIGGTGATVVRYDGSRWIFPEPNPNGPVIFDFPITVPGLRENDLLVIGGGSEKPLENMERKMSAQQYANLACIAAALMLLEL